MLYSVAHDPEHPTVVIVSIHQPNSHLYQKFDKILVLSHGRTLYNGLGGFAPSQELASRGIAYPQGYNVADHLLDVASDPPAHLFQSGTSKTQVRDSEEGNTSLEKGYPPSGPRFWNTPDIASYATTFLTQLEVLSGREWKILRRYELPIDYHNVLKFLRRDKSLFLTHVLVSTILGVFCGGYLVNEIEFFPCSAESFTGGLYYKTGITIAGFQSRVGCLFFLVGILFLSNLLTILIPKGVSRVH